ncbi:MAG: AAA family ATPase, partial [Candidatus Binatia bacterium]
YTPRHLAQKILTTRAALEGERKTVTVLFGDVADFTSLSTRLDPEDLHGVMDGCFQPIVEAVHRYEGTVNQFTGDGVMALFGAPIAHEDHAVRAIAAAVAIQRALARYAEELQRARGIVFGMRIGLNTGPVVVGKIGDDLRMDYTAQGETVNLAARLQSAATKGEVLVSEATRRLASRACLFDDRGALELKGLGQPVQAFVVTGERPARSRFELSAEEGLTPLVGRRRELAFLDETLARVRDGHGYAVSVVGEAGIGKSRLVHEIVRGPRGASFGFARAQGLPHGESAPFDVVRTLLVEILGRSGDASEVVRAQQVESALGAELGWAAPYVKHLLALPAPELDAEGLDATQRKRRTFDSVRAVVARAAATRPLVLIIEDLQWIDRSSEELLRALVDALAEHPILLLATIRSGFVPSWDDRSFHHRLVVGPLERADAVAIVDAVSARVGEAEPGGNHSARDAIAARAEGNPLFLEELARYVRGARVARSSEGELPERILDLLTARIDRLPEPVKRTLQRASVLGLEFPV